MRGCTHAIRSSVAYVVKVRLAGVFLRAEEEHVLGEVRQAG